MQKYLGYVFILLAACCWGLTGPVARFVLEKGMSPIEVGFWRAALGGLFFALHSAGTRSWKVHRLHDGLFFCLFGAVGIGGFFACYQYAVKTGGAALAAVLMYTAPAWVAVFSRCLFGEQLTRVKLAAIALSLAGVACISLPGGETFLSHSPVAEGSSGEGGQGFFAGVNGLGVGFGLLSGFLYSTHYIMSKKYLQKYKTSTLYGYCMLFGALVLFPYISFTQKSAIDCLALMTLGLICTYGAYLAYCEGIKRLALTRAAVLATLEPVIATFFAWWLWGEMFFFTGWIGTAFIVSAVLCMLLEKKN